MFERRSDLVRLLAVADAQRIVTAADRLAMTQPALSRVIARLEREFGGRLFERVPSGVRPTRLGAIVIERARRIIRETADGEAAVAAELAGHAGRYRVTAAPVWLHAVLVPAVAQYHAAFPEVELKLRAASWREGVRLLADGESDLHVGGLDSGEALPGFLRRERFIELTAGIAAAVDHPLRAARPGPRELAGWPWIDLDGEPADCRPSLSALLAEIGGRAGRRVRPVLHAESSGLLLLATGPWLARLPLDLLDALPGAPIAPLPLPFGRRRYRTGFVARRSAEDHAPFRQLQETVRETALASSRRPAG